MQYLFSLEMKPFLTFELLFALIYIEAKRDPEKIVMIWFVQVKSKKLKYLQKIEINWNFLIFLIDAFSPWVLLFFSLITGGDIVSDLIGIAAGHLFYYLKDLAPINHNLDLLKTPGFLKDYFRDSGSNRAQVAQTREAERVSGINNQNSSGSFGNASTSTSSTTYRPQADTSSSTANQFRPFSGRGTSWGS